jgi:hypothetical protein
MSEKGSAYWVLFEHMSQEHKLTLLDSELADICAAVDRMRKQWKASDESTAESESGSDEEPDFTLDDLEWSVKYPHLCD